MTEINKQLQQSYEYCRMITRSNSSFYLGIMFSKNKDKRNSLFSIYAWLRTIDDYADNTIYTPGERVDQLRLFFDKTLNIIQTQPLPDDELYWPAFRQTIIDYQIPIDYLEGMIAGQQQDLIKDNYQSFDELYQYCRMVASMVGLMCICVWGYTTKAKANANEVKQLAEWAGIALQLTNILRDVANDLALNRVYIPAEFANKERLTSRNYALVPQEELMHAINKLINLTQSYYDKSEPLGQLINPDSKLSFLLIVGIYRAIFNKIKENPMMVLAENKITLTKFEKFCFIFKTIIIFYIKK